MSFDIRFTQPSDAGSWGELSFQGCIEVFESNFLYWNKDDYERSWKRAIAEIIHSETTSALVVWMSNPKDAPCITWWPMYREGDAVIFQNAICDLSCHSAVEDDFEIFSLIPKRVDCEAVSEWTVTLEILQTWLSKV